MSFTLTKRSSITAIALTLYLSTIEVAISSASTATTQAMAGCSYVDADLNLGYGFNHETGLSCPPLLYSDDTNSDHCSYRDASQNDGWGYNVVTGQSCPPQAGINSGHLVLQFKGTGTAVETSYDTTGDGVADTTANCFEAPLYNPSTGEQVGTGSDCLDVETNDEGNIRLSGTGFFNLADGALVVQGLTTVRPVLQPTTRDGIEFTHITGANSDSGILYGSGRYQDASGAVRLSGMVDMSKLESDGQIHFDCLFVVDFKL